MKFTLIIDDREGYGFIAELKNVDRYLLQDLFDRPENLDLFMAGYQSGLDAIEKGLDRE